MMQAKARVSLELLQGGPDRASGLPGFGFFFFFCEPSLHSTQSPPLQASEKQTGVPEMREELFKLMREHVYRFRQEPFLLASGLKSQHYFNCKKITLVPERLWLLSKHIVEDVLERRLPQAAGGLTLGADPLAYGMSLYAHSVGLRMLPLVVRKKGKDHGMAQLIEGERDGLAGALVLDDVITTGMSTLQAVEALRSAGLKVSQALCILDREEGGRAELQKAGIELISVFKKSDFLSQAS
jgi:orotate phosphoribosyltransferase